jgi:small nuclear ribonucleoprotein (snRNP)-like protein
VFDPYPTLRAVIVHTKSQKSFRGTLWKRKRGYLVLKDVHWLQSDGSSKVIDGEVLIMADNVDFIQVVF